ncbi:MAG TPA: PDZ domain-containing protein [Gemmataceae bacterium]|nr:PDZ domain-containing protein [Gemmataceae bacterium]
MYRFLLPAGVVALFIGAMVLFAQQGREGAQKDSPPPAATPQKGVAAGEKAPADKDKQAATRRGRCRCYLGVCTVPVEDMSNRTRRKLKLPSNDGVFVIEVIPDSPADEAGIRHGDVITHVNNKLVDDEEELCKDLNKLGPGKEVNLCVLREGKKENIKAELEEIPAGRQFARAFGSEDRDEEMMGMCQENAQRIEQLERKIHRLEKRLSEMEKSRSSK